jgi:UDP-N-acetyl-D-mannosaminuronic acid transferase (WecB/TagA/CpsF family)
MSYLVNYLNSGVLFGVGQAFALTASGNKNKMQTTFRKYKLEWLYRLIIEPGKTFNRLVKEGWYLPQIIVKEIIKR